MKKTGYERQHKNDIYYSTDTAGCALKHFDFHDLSNNDAYAVANYYSDETVARNNTRADKLMRQLRRFAVENNDAEIDWKRENDAKWYFWFDYRSKGIYIDFEHERREFGQIYFSSRTVAQKAVNTFADELMWYFTEYCDHVVENKSEIGVDGCELCKGGYFKKVVICKNQMWRCEDGLKIDDEQKVKFCPKCGRKLMRE